MVTTIQLNLEVKKALDNLKKGKETYEQIIVNLIRLAELQGRQQESLLIEGCNELSSENLKITKEFEGIEDLSDWEW